MHLIPRSIKKPVAADDVTKHELVAGVVLKSSVLCVCVFCVLAPDEVKNDTRAQSSGTASTLGAQPQPHETCGHKTWTNFDLHTSEHV